MNPDRLAAAHRTARDALLAERTPGGWWVGELSGSALSTATTVSAFSLVAAALPHRTDLIALRQRGLEWLAAHQNPDGGWGDTDRSFSNISTTMLVRAAVHLAGAADRYAAVLQRAEGYIGRVGGIAAVRRRYGKDKTFSAPILTNCALAGQADWREVDPLPFELACLPHAWFASLSLPVVSYALPALIAIGQIRHHRRPSWNPLVRLIRNRAVEPSLAKLIAIQPESGGFLEAAPLTGFVTMSLAAMGRADHPVAERGVRFLTESVRPDGCWPIDTNLSVWLTTLSINALLGNDETARYEEEPLSPADRNALREWLLARQYRQVHPYTNAAPGGWAWTDLSGGVPDADDTPGALLALANLGGGAEVESASAAGVKWLLDLQNDDGGWPTFCRGWTNLPFDRSGPDLTAHALRALRAAGDRRAAAAVRRGLAYLTRTQRPDGGWLPLWFGNQHAPDDENPVYGTARVLAAYRDLGRLGDPAARRGADLLVRLQNPDGGWGGSAGCPSSVEETALAAEALLDAAGPQSPAVVRGLAWLVARVEDGAFRTASPIGFYFAKLWYYERLYPLIFTVSALGRAAARRH
jgi:squalene-hopene/tetraprenyl-beta-curcumene cyclase